MNEVGRKATRDARPIHRVYIDGFFMDATDVTNAQFASFVRAAGYVTVAEGRPREEDFPGIPPEDLIPGSVVFSPPDHVVPLNNHFEWWHYMPGANWRHPLGPESDIKGKNDYPVVNIAYEDAAAYAKWAKICPVRDAAVHHIRRCLRATNFGQLQQEPGLLTVSHLRLGS
jgi:formylglycine-generating enzyme required for sulfatase activity